MDSDIIDFSYLNELGKIGKEKTSVVKGSSSSKESVRHPDNAAIKAVLEKKKHSQQLKDEKYNQDRQNLLALRAKDRKSHKRMSAMIKRTKGYSKSVVEDAKDLTTARGEQQCDEDDYGYESTISQQIFDKLAVQYRSMPEDDRLKFKKVKVDNINDVKNRVLNSLKKQEEEENGPRKRKRKHRESEADEFINDGDPYNKDNEGTEDSKEGCRDKESEKREEKEKSKNSVPKMPVNLNLTNYKTKDNEKFKYDYEPKKKEENIKQEKKKRRLNQNQPPAMNFADLMKLAQTKQKETHVEKVADLLQEKLKERDALIKRKKETPLTTAEKEQQEEERLRRLRRAGKLPNLPIDQLKVLAERKKNKESGKEEVKKEDTSSKDNEKSQSSKSNNSNSSSSMKNSNNSSSSSGKNSTKEQEKPSKDKEKPKEPPKPDPKIRDRSKYFAVPNTSKSILETKLTEYKSKSCSTSLESEKTQDNKARLTIDSKQKISNNKSRSPLDSKFKEHESKSLPPVNNKYKTLNSKSRLSEPSSSKPPLSSFKSPAASKSRPFPPPDVKSSKKPSSSSTRQFPPSDLKPLKRPGALSQRGGSSDSSRQGRRPNCIDSDEDSEYDSEMDDFIDDGEEDLDYSSEIKKMFGYDKSKFRDEDDDLSDMEVGYSQVEREEKRSAEIGLMEDLEDMKQEEAERRSKLAKKKAGMIKGRR